MKYIYRLFLVITLLSCSNGRKTTRTLMKEWFGKTIQFPNKLGDKLQIKDEGANLDFFKSKYKILVYVDTLGCYSCSLKLETWKEVINELDTIPVLFYFISRYKDDIDVFLRLARFNYPVFVDQKDSLNKLNRFPSDSRFHTFLLSRSNKILAIGNPVHNFKVKELYKNIILGKLEEDKSKKSKTLVEVMKTEVDLQDFLWKKSQECSFSIKNIGDKPLVINYISASCGCLKVEYEKKPILPNETALLKLEYKAKQSEFFNKKIAVYCNVPNSPIFLKIKGHARK